jgi:dihydroorotate dehydrogenase
VARLSDRRLGLIGAGGVANGWQAYAKILVGADLVQLYSGLALEGPHLPGLILHQLAAMMDADGISAPHQIKGQIPDPVKAIKYAKGLCEKISEQ